MSEVRHDEPPLAASTSDVRVDVPGGLTLLHPAADTSDMVQTLVPGFLATLHSDLEAATAALALDDVAVNTFFRPVAGDPSSAIAVSLVDLPIHGCGDVVVLLDLHPRLDGGTPPFRHSGGCHHSHAHKQGNGRNECDSSTRHPVSFRKVPALCRNSKYSIPLFLR